MFYFIRQNNSGGYFIKNDDVAEYLIIEANNKSEYEDKLEEVTKNYSEFCPCCGERWNTRMSDGSETPMIYGKPVQEFLNSERWYKDKEIIIYYLDGRRERVVSINKDNL